MYNSEIQEDIAGNLLALFPLFKRKLAKPFDHLAGTDISHAQFHLMLILRELGSLTMSEIAKKMMVSKSNVTPLANKLINSGMIARISDQADRRIINITLTNEGLAFLAEQNRVMISLLKDRLSDLPQDDLETLSHSLQNVTSIISKLK